MKAWIFAVKFLFSVFLIFFCYRCTAQNKFLHYAGKQFFYLKEIPQQEVLLNEGWKFYSGDNMSWAAPAFNDTDWEYINPAKDINEYEKLKQARTCWLRLYLWVDSSINNNLFAMHIQQNVASEIYLDGKRIITYGTLNNKVNKVRAFNPLNEPLPLHFENNKLHVLAVRIFLPRKSPYIIYPGVSNSFFNASVREWNQGKRYIHNSTQLGFELSLFKSSIFIFMFFLHFAFYMFYQKQKVNFFFGLFSFCSAAAFILYALLVYTIHDVQLSNFFKIPALLLFPVSGWLTIEGFYAWYNYKRTWGYKIFFALMLFAIAACFTPFNTREKWVADIPFFYFPLIVHIECLRISVKTFMKKNKPAISAVIPFVTVYILAMIATLFLIHIKTYNINSLLLLFGLLINIALLSLPVGIFKYTALEFKYYNRQLEKARALKNKIELDLHDDLGSKLSTLRLFLKRLQIQKNADNSLLLDNSLRLLDTSIGDLRQMMNELQTSILVEKGYITATEELINKINYLQQINFILTHNGFNKRFEHKTEYNLFRITQELVNNTLKYADAKSVTLSIVNRDDKIIFMYEDDGKGFDVRCDRKGFGLRNIASRSEFLGGTVEFDSMPGKGFRTIIELPLVYAAT